VTNDHRIRQILHGRGDLLAVIATGGAVGSLARWGLAEAIPPTADEFPWATFAANVSGCLVLGALMVLVSEVWPPSRYLRPFLGVGVLGGYTTFSTAMLEARALLIFGHPGTAGIYLIGTLAGGLTAVRVGMVAVRTPVARSRRRRARRGTGDPDGVRPTPTRRSQR
jgi:CrcB protein